MRTINIKTRIPKDHRLVINIPEDFPAGLAEVVIIIEQKELKGTKGGKTAGDMLNSSLFGLWKDRKDITNSVKFAKKLRENSERRYGKN